MKTESKGFLIDTNLLVYVVDKSDQLKQKLIENWVDSLGKNVFISTQSLREFAHICLRKKLLEPESIIEYIETFSARFIVFEDYFTDTKTAIELCRDYPNLFWDANIVAVMLRNGIDCIYTENTKDFENLGVKAINPLK